MPLDPKLTKFTTAQQAIRSYDYTDIANGTGVEIFYLMNENTGATDDYLLSPNIIYSNDVLSSAGSATTSASRVLDLDFDVIFNIPRDIKGDIIISIPIFAQRGPSYDHTTYAIIKARHVDTDSPPNETELGSAQTESVTGTAGASTYVDGIRTVKINIASVIHFAQGETLRITVEIWGQTGNAAEARQHGFGHDPKSRAQATVFPTIPTSTTEVHVPFLPFD